jgi:hypothetical protein
VADNVAAFPVVATVAKVRRLLDGLTGAVLVGLGLRLATEKRHGV